MTDQQIARGRRAVACSGWRWKRGCPWERPPSGGWGVADGMFSPPDGALPDFSEPAAVGCLVSLAREALGEPGAGSAHFAYDWSIERYDTDSDDWQALYRDGTWGTPGRYGVISEPSEPEAWLAALEAAGRRDGKAENQRTG